MTQEDKELLPCPACLESNAIRPMQSDEIIHHSNYKVAYIDFKVICEKCGFSGKYQPTQQQAIAVWNTRAKAKANSVVDEDKERKAFEMWEIETYPHYKGDQEVFKAGWQAAKAAKADSTTDFMSCLLCNDRAAAICYFPNGCTCKPDNKYQPRCHQHISDADSNEGEFYIVETFSNDKAAPNLMEDIKRLIFDIICDNTFQDSGEVHGQSQATEEIIKALAAAGVMFKGNQYGK